LRKASDKLKYEDIIDEDLKKDIKELRSDIKRLRKEKKIEKLKHYYKIYKVTSEMLVDRGYQGRNNTSYEYFEDYVKNKYKDNKEKGFEQIIRNKINFMTGDLFLCCFEIISEDIIKSVKRFTKKNNCNRCIIIVSSKKRIVSNIKDMIMLNGFELFFENKVTFNPTKNENVPKHLLLNEEQKAIALKDFKNQNDKLIKIKVDDPISRYFGARIGNVFKIIRPSETSGFYSILRIVTP